MSLTALILMVFGFTCGALPLAYWVGRYGLKDDIRTYGDGNPGAFNVIRAGGPAWGALAIFLEIGKAALPVGLAAYILQLEGLELILVSITPPLGHAFSPFLGFKGGKAIAASGGVLIGISLWELPTVAMGALVIWYLTLTASGWAVMFTTATLLLYEVIAGVPTDWLIVTVLLTLILAQRHRAELIHRPQIKPNLLRSLPSSTEQDRDSGSHIHNGSTDRH